MFENMMKFIKKFTKKQTNTSSSKDKAKERLHLVLMQDRANVSADFLDLMRQEIIDVIKKYIEIDESAIDVRLTNKENEDGTNGAPALYANIPIINIKEEVKENKDSATTFQTDEQNETGKHSNNTNNVVEEKSQKDEQNVKEEATKSDENDIKEKEEDSINKKQNEKKENN